MMNLRRPSLFFALALLLGFVGNVPAQSTAGNIAGEASAGETIVIEGADNGFHREIKIKKDGKYRVNHVPTGTYHVVKTHADGSSDPTRTVTVIVGSTARVM